MTREGNGIGTSCGARSSHGVGINLGELLPHGSGIGPGERSPHGVGGGCHWSRAGAGERRLSEVSREGLDGRECEFGPSWETVDILLARRSCLY